MKHIALALAFLVAGCFSAAAQGGPQKATDLKSEMWNAKWISVPETGSLDYGVYYFRKDLELAAVPDSYTVHVSGDNRYKLYVNDKLVSLGPAKGDAAHWNYETVDLSPYLRNGRNVIAAVVYNEGPRRPDSQVSVETGFLLQGEGEAAGLYTDRSWKCIQDRAYSPVTAIVSGYYVAGPGERVDLRETVYDWKGSGADLSVWLPAREGKAGEPKDVMSSDQGATHCLVPSTLPQMERTPFQIGKAFTVPARSKEEILLDNGVLTNAYFHLRMSGGKDASINIGYAESLYIPDGDGPAYQLTPEQLAQVPEEYLNYVLSPKVKGKGNRNETEGKIFVGREDQLVSNGSENQEYTTLSWRTFRYVRIQVETGEEPLTVNEVSGVFTGYPFTLDSRLDTDNRELKDILEIGWRTARLCAWETYMDCPYYEQLQYLGDTRIQALVTLYNSKDDRLVKNFLHLADISRDADGITKARYPTTIPQHIQPYALSYIYALHDYLMYGTDTDFVMDLLPGAEQILHYFSRFQLPDGRLRNLPGWNFSDWVEDRPNWGNGAPLKGADGCSILMDLQLLYAYQQMAHMEEVRGNTWQAGEYRAKASQLSDGVRKAYWNESKGLFADRVEQDTYSQHANALAILCGIAEDPGAIARKLMTDESLAQCTVYYKYYLHEAYAKAGMGDGYLDWLDIWRENMAMGLTTWAETSDVNGTRSDCHAWGASPNIEMFRTVLGIDSDAVAFKRVRIEPHLGSIKEIGGSIPHPSGTISVQYKVNGSHIQATVELPDDVDGLFVWNGKEQYLRSGKNNVKL
jgi:hypothetical protein